MSGGQRRTLLQSLSGEDKQRVLLLVQRLQEQTEGRARYMQLYEQSQQELNTLQLKFNQLKDQNKYLKQQIHNSFSIVSQVRAQFKANKQPIKQTQEDQWEDQQSDQENHMQNHTHSTLIKPPKPHSAIKIRKEIQNTPILNLSQSQLNQTQFPSSSRSQELQQLRKEVRMLQQEKRAKQAQEKSINEKYRLVDQIKNRYRKQFAHESIDISATFEDEEKGKEEVVGYSSRKQKEKSKEISEKKKEKSIEKDEKGSENKDKIKQKIKSKKESDKGINNRQKITQSKSKVVKAEDYGDVFEMINSYNL